MYIGDILKERMQALDIDIATLAEDTFLDESYIISIINNEVDINDIDELDLEFISSALYCMPKYFVDKKVRSWDIIHASMNRGICDANTNIVKGKLQQFANDFIFLKNVIAEAKGGT